MLLGDEAVDRNSVFNLNFKLVFIIGPCPSHADDEGEIFEEGEGGIFHCL